MKVNILRFFLILTSCTVILSSLNALAEKQKPTEYQVKAAFAYNFTKFVEWPNESHSMKLTLCVLGKSPLSTAVDAIEGKIIRGKRLHVRHIKSLQDAKECNILFIASTEKQNLAHLIKAVEGSRILTIADTVGFAEQGVIINLYIKEKKVRFKINIEAARRAGLKISSKLLKLAKIVTSTSQR